MKDVGVLCGDLHFRHIAPVARQEKDKDWYGVMYRYCEQLRNIAGDLPIFCTGDIFHKWNSPSELINFLISNMPRMHAVPGNHDLPLHNYKDLHKSAYWTLVKAKVIRNLDPDSVLELEKLHVHAFPHGFPLSPLPEDRRKDGVLHLAIVHQYIWTGGCTYPDAPSDNMAANVLPRLDGYTSAAFGDNHISFSLPPDRGTLINCGTFIRQKTDEYNLHPCVGVLRSDGTIRVSQLDTSEDRWEEEIVSTVKKVKNIDLESFLEMLNDGGEVSLDFTDAVRRCVMQQKTPGPILRIINRALDGGK